MWMDVLPATLDLLRKISMIKKPGITIMNLYPISGWPIPLNNSILFGLEAGYVAARANPTTNADTIVQSIRQKQVPIQLIANVNTFNKAVFPTSGTRVHLSIGYNVDVVEEVQTKSDNQWYSSHRSLTSCTYSRYNNIYLLAKKYPFTGI